MNREIKFRGKAKYDHMVGQTVAGGEWVYGYFVEDSPGLPSIFHETDENDWRFVAINVTTLGQFTGLIDSSGKEVYEGDIIECTRKEWKCMGHPEDGKTVIDIHEVYWCTEDHAFKRRGRFKTGGGWSGSLDFADDRAKETIIKIIGNAFDNPELLKP